MKSLAENLKKYRKVTNLTQNQLADILGIKRARYSYYELGKVEPSIDVLMAIAGVFNITVDELLTESSVDEDKACKCPPEELLFDVKDNFNDLDKFEKYLVAKSRTLSRLEKNRLVELIKELENE